MGVKSFSSKRVEVEGQARHVVGIVGLQPGLGRDVGDVGDRVGVQARELEGLAEQRVDRGPRVERHRVLGARVQAHAPFHAVVARELVPLEDGRVVEHEALGILVGQVAGVDLVGPGNELRDGLDRLRPDRGRLDEGVAPFEPDPW